MKHGRITMRDTQLWIEAPPHVSIRLRRLFGGAQRYRAGVFMLAATPEHAYDLEWFRERHPLDRGHPLRLPLPSRQLPLLHNGEASAA